MSQQAEHEEIKKKILTTGIRVGTEVKIDGKEYSIMKESDIMGISKGKK